jgi:hypothetical protein
MFKKIIDWIAGLFQGDQTKYDAEIPASKALPPVHFSTIEIVSKPPKNNEVVTGALYCTVSADKPKWSLFSCPCGCGDIVTLSLQSAHRPYWKLTKMDSGRPTLYPSVWRDKGCLSHFWVKDGRVFWCDDTGSHPDLRAFT